MTMVPIMAVRPMVVTMASVVHAVQLTVAPASVDPVDDAVATSAMEGARFRMGAGGRDQERGGDRDPQSPVHGLHRFAPPPRRGRLVLNEERECGTPRTAEAGDPPSNAQCDEGSRNSPE